LEADGKDALPEIIELMDYYYLTKEDWDSIVELGVGPMSEDKISIPSAVKSAFTRTYNQQSHPMPFIKASPVGAIRASKKDAPDIEDAIVESEDEGADVAEATKSDEDDADISKGKYVQKPKKKKVTKGKGKALTGDDSAKKSTAKGKGKATGRGKKVS
jgi:replication factor C subunit 1